MHVKTPMRSRLCLFEFVYFARPDSVIDGINVYQSRVEAGKRLAIDDDVEADMVIGVPDSALAAAMATPSRAGFPMATGWPKPLRRPHVHPAGQGMREGGVRTLQRADPQRSRQAADSGGRFHRPRHGRAARSSRCCARRARRKCMRISSPSVLNPRYFGIDTATSEELIGHSRSAEEICPLHRGGQPQVPFPARSAQDGGRFVAANSARAAFDGDYPIDRKRARCTDGGRT